jgi:hypothetical protein
MKVNFEYYGEVHRLKVTKELIHINNLTNILASEDMADSDEYDNAYDFLMEASCKVFAKKAKSLKKRNPKHLYAEFLQTSDKDTCSLRVRILNV